MPDNGPQIYHGVRRYENEETIKFFIRPLDLVSRDDLRPSDAAGYSVAILEEMRTNLERRNPGLEVWTEYRSPDFRKTQPGDFFKRTDELGFTRPHVMAKESMQTRAEWQNQMEKMMREEFEAAREKIKPMTGEPKKSEDGAHAVRARASKIDTGMIL